MASAHRKPDTALIDLLVSEGHRFGFFPAVHLLHRLQTDRQAVGELGPISKEALRFRQSTKLIFHPGDVDSIEVKEDVPVLTATFLGLFGTASPLAVHFSEKVIEAEENDEFSLRAFYDIFHHRLISLYYRAWKKYRVHASFHTGGEDSATKRLLCFVGSDGHGATAESGLEKLESLAIAPLLAMRARPPRVLLLALQRLLPGIAVRIEPFILRKAAIHEEDRMRLGVSCNRLNVDCTLGAHIQDRSARFRVILGPMSYSRCEAFMPGGADYPVVRRVIEQFTRGTLECELDVLLEEEGSPGFILGGQRPSSLGVNTRLGGGRAGKEARMRVLLTDETSGARPSLIEVNQ